MNPATALLDTFTASGALGQPSPRPEPTFDKAVALRASREFEAVFLTQMFESMFSGIKTEGPFGGGPAEKIFRSMLNQEYAAAMAESGGVGVADAVMAEILKIQEAAR